MNMHEPDIRAVPENIEAEQALLGAVLTNNRAFDRVADFLESQHFFEPLHRRIFEVAGDMIRANKTVNPVLIKSFLTPDVKDLKVDGEPATVPQYLARLAVSAAPILNARDYGEAIHEMWIRRQAIVACEDVVSIAYDLPPDKDVLNELGPIEDRIATLRAERVRGDQKRGVGTRYLDSLSDAYKRGSVTGVPVCHAELAEVISEPSFEVGNLYGMLSSSGEGKTSLTVQMITHALRAGHPVLFLSYDQSSDQIMRQMIAQAEGIEARRQRDPKLLSQKELETCMDFARWVDGQPFEIAKCTTQNAAQLVGFARTFTRRFPAKKDPLIVVDHIQSVAEDDRRADPGTKAKQKNQMFKAAAESTRSAWLVLNQRNSKGLERDNPRPIAADLYGGEAARYDYDAIFYLYRFMKFYLERKAIASKDADFATIKKVFPSAVREDGADIAELGALKVRFGSPNITRTLRFEDRFTRYVSERVEPEQQDML